MDFDLVVKNGRIATASDVSSIPLDIGVKDGKIVCIGSSLPTGSQTKTIDAEGAYVTPGGVDSHVHLSQALAPTGDGWETGSRSAIAGGTTTIIAFADQQRSDTSLFPVLEAYHAKAKDVTYCDYAFHFILTNPTPSILNNELPLMMTREGITSVKLYMTYEPMKLTDAELLSVLLACRTIGMTTMIHAENSDMIALIISRLEEAGHTAPYFHAIARPQIAESEASYRAIALAELVDAPILIVHMSADNAVAHVRAAQDRLLPVHAETCPHYLFLLSEELQAKEHDHFEGAKHVCSPPLRHKVEDLDAIWRSVANGTFTVISSDHAPSQYDNMDGKKRGLVNGIPKFSSIPNGLPGLETRMALLFGQTEACLPKEKARLTLSRFVALTSTNAAKLYGLQGRKGSIAVGYDADIVVWYPESRGETVIAQKSMHHGVDYTPFEGMKVGNWPRYTIVRGNVVWDRDNGEIVGKKDFGMFLKRDKGELVTGRMGGLPKGMLEGERDYWMDSQETKD